MEQCMRAQQLHAMPGIALPHEAEVVGPCGASSGDDSGTKSLATRVRDGQVDATRRVCARAYLNFLLA